QGLQAAVKKIQIITDNKAVKKLAQEALEKLQLEVFLKKICFSAVQTGFSTRDYLRAKANAELDFQAAASSLPPSRTYSDAPSDIGHPELFARLKKWRTAYAEQYELEAYQVLFTKTLIEIVQTLPADIPALRKIKGIGKAKSKQFGADLLQLVQDYCLERGISTHPLDLSDVEPEKAPKPDTKRLSYELFQMGKTIDEIAAERGLVRSTIEGHLAHFVGLGEIDIFELVPEEDVRAIEGFFMEQQTTVSGEAKAHFGEKYSYGEIKLVLAWMSQASS
ncbi:MAG: helix-turn-helix domain-containing protein, partial [Saprospiraceae bacterium]|nr:helix-turn-helix domain-containing protein [Saprospiraceae bacterium]